MGRKILEAVALILSLLIGALILMVSFVTVSCASRPTNEQRGCYVHIGSRDGRPTAFYEPFLKVGDKEALSEDGLPEIWGFKVWERAIPGSDGLVYPINILESRFVRKGEIKLVAGVQCKCPDWSGW